MSAAPLAWSRILRLGLIQAALGAMVVLATSTFGRIMTIEAGLPALVPGLLVGLHYAVQLLRPRFGHGSDIGGLRTPWILGGLAVLAAGTVIAAIGTALAGSLPAAGIALAAAGYGLVGLGAGAAGTTLLVLIASAVDEGRRATAATIVWTMMIAGFALAAGIAGRLLDPYSPARLVWVAIGLCTTALVVAGVALGRLERRLPQAGAARPAMQAISFWRALADVWGEPRARRFTLFVLVSMLAYSAQALVLQPFAGAVFHLTPGATTGLAGLQHGGVLAGMILCAAVALVGKGRAFGSARLWTFGGCIGSAMGVLALAAASLAGPGWPLAPTLFANGMANGAFAVAAITAMMQLVGAGQGARSGVRMGLWGSAQAIAFALGSLAGAAASDLGRRLTDQPGSGYAAVFITEAILFLWAAHLSTRVFGDAVARPDHDAPSTGIVSAGGMT